MRSPLHQRIAALRGRVRRLLALHGLSLVVAGLAVFVLAAVLRRLGRSTWPARSAWPCSSG